ncbi:MAG: hypothetical protein KF694_01745 [Mesorhizobium sp.]|nr:hypothetical protein [Mesorhizobium sp.]
MAVSSWCRIIIPGAKEAGGLNDGYRRPTVPGRGIIGRGGHGRVGPGKSFQGQCLRADGYGRLRCGYLNPGYCYDARLRPADYNGQSNSTRLSLFVPFWTMNFTLPVGNLVGTTFKPVKATAIGQSASQYNASARIPAMAPAAPTAATIFVTATIDINAFDVDAPSCNVRLRFQGQRFPMP